MRNCIGPVSSSLPVVPMSELLILWVLCFGRAPFLGGANASCFVAVVPDSFDFVTVYLTRVVGRHAPFHWSCMPAHLPLVNCASLRGFLRGSRAIPAVQGC